MSAPSASVTPIDRNDVAKINDEVAVGEDLQFQRSWWKFERAVWVFFVFVLVLDLSGAFGRGPLANATLTSTDGALQVRYERIERVGTPSMMTVTFNQGALRDRYARLSVSDSVISKLGTQRVIPQPESTIIEKGRISYAFPAGSAPAVVRLQLEPDSAGIFRFEIATPGSEPLQAKVFVVP